MTEQTKMTPEHFKSFRELCENWLGVLGIADYEVEFKCSALDENTWATTCSDSKGKTAIITLNSTLPCEESETQTSLDSTAFHEACEVMVADLWYYIPDACGEEVEGVIHSIINRLSKVIRGNFSKEN